MQAVVSTMKTLAATRIRQFETAAEASQAYGETVELALQIVMRHRVADGHRESDPVENQATGLVLMGSDQGFCGRFNEVVLEAALAHVDSIQPLKRPRVLTVGSRLGQLAESSSLDVDLALNVPSSAADITSTLQKITPRIQQWQQEFDVRCIELFYNQHRSTTSFETTRYQVLPISHKYLTHLQANPWQSRSLPILHGSWRELFSLAVRQHLFLILYRACAESLASENASRMAAMQHAEKNIEKRMMDLNSEFNFNRQRAITEELLEIMSGFETVTSNARPPNERALALEPLAADTQSRS